MAGTRIAYPPRSAMALASGTPCWFVRTSRRRCVDEDLVDEGFVAGGGVVLEDPHGDLAGGAVDAAGGRTSQSSSSTPKWSRSS